MTESGTYHAQALDRVDTTTASANNDDLLLLRLNLLRLGLGHNPANLAVHLLLRGRDEDLAILLECLEVPERIETGCILNVGRADVEARPMPWTNDPAILGQDTLC